MRLHWGVPFEFGLIGAVVASPGRFRVFVHNELIY